jgi:hypothetical protein
VIVFEGEALCAACDDGTHPPMTEQRRPEPQPAPQPERAAVAPEQESEPRKVHMSQKRLTPSEIAAIQEAPLSEPTAALARRLGLSGNAVSYQRLVFQRKAKSPSNIQPPRKTEPAVDDWVPEPDTTLRESRQVSFNVDAQTLDAWWKSQTIEFKASVFASNYVIRVEGSFQ